MGAAHRLGTSGESKRDGNAVEQDQQERGQSSPPMTMKTNPLASTIAATVSCN